MTRRGSIGFRPHTGWATLVAVAVEGDALLVLQRCRIELVPPGLERFVYHKAAEMPLADAVRLIESVRHTAEDTALTAIRSAIRDLKVTGAGIPAGTMAVPDDLTTVLRSHARIHAAEGALYAGAIASACKHLEIPLIAVRERDVWSLASASAGMSEANLKSRIDAVRNAIGPPWTADHKLATAAALLKP